MLILKIFYLPFFSPREQTKLHNTVNPYIDDSSGQITPTEGKKTISPNGRKAFWAFIWSSPCTLVICQISSQPDNTQKCLVEQTLNGRWLS